MKKIILVTFCLSLCISSLNTSYSQIVYKYYNDKITLYENNEFHIEINHHLNSGESWGNWRLYGDSILILDENPKCSYIDVIEKRKREKRGVSTIIIPQPGPSNIIKYHYKISVIMLNNDTLDLLPTGEETIINHEIKAIYLKDPKNIITNIVYKKKKSSNIFYVNPHFIDAWDNKPFIIREDCIVPIQLNY